MHGIPILFTLWPGLPQLWLQGRWAGLWKAIAFAVFLNFVLFATYQQKELLPKSGLIACWIVVGVCWTVAIFQNDWVVKNHSKSKSEDSKELDRLFQLAQLEYLQGRWIEAESHLERILGINPDDLDSRLYLATIHRHRGRLHQASRHLDLIELDPEHEKWFFQVLEEREKIAELEQELTGSTGSEELLSGNPIDSTVGEKQNEDSLSEPDSHAAFPPDSNRFAA